MCLYKLRFKIDNGVRHFHKRVLVLANSLEDAISLASAKLTKGYDNDTTAEIVGFEKHAVDKPLVWVIPSEEV